MSDMKKENVNSAGTISEEKPWGDGEDYNRYIISELASFRKEAWKKQIISHFDGRKDIRILDVGTGPGFFPCILAEEGYQVTGMDYSKKMLCCAEENAKRLGVHCDFVQMDINDLLFEDASYDVIINRNVTWTLSNPKETYKEFYRILKKGGILLIYDANWHLHFFDDTLLEKVRANEERYFQKYGKKEVVAINNQEFFAHAPLTKIYRPSWDENVLRQMGMKVKIEENIGETVYEQWEKELYDQSPLFEICARK